MTAMQKRKIHSCTADWLGYERASFDSWEISGQRDGELDNWLHWETGNEVENDVISRSPPFIQPPGINWVTRTSYPSLPWSFKRKIPGSKKPGPRSPYSRASYACKPHKSKQGVPSFNVERDTLKITQLHLRLFASLCLSRPLYEQCPWSARIGPEGWLRVSW